MLLAPRDARVATTRVGRHVDRFVDDAEIARVVNEALMRVDLAVDARPEMNVGLELGGAREYVVGESRAADIERKDQKPECCTGQDAIHAYKSLFSFLERIMQRILLSSCPVPVMLVAKRA